MPRDPKSPTKTLPKLLGGRNSNNLVAACRPCNVIKGRRVFGSFEEAKTYVLQRRAELHKEWEAKMARRQNQPVTA